MDGFYTAFLTGRGGTTILLFALKGGKLIGIDAGGLKYSGLVKQGSNQTIDFHIEYVLVPGTPLITGVGAVPSATPVTLDFTAPADFASGAIITIQTPFGPINAKISKIGEIDI